MVQYYYLCEHCEYFFHCFDEEARKKIKNKNKDEDLYLRPKSCNDFYPEI